MCQTCQPAEDAERKAGRLHQTRQRKEMSAVAAYAKAHRSVVCWLCESRKPPKGYSGRWSGDHVDAGVLGSEILPAHLGCNSARGSRSVEWFRAHIRDNGLV